MCFLSRPRFSVVAASHKCKWMKTVVENSRPWPHTMFQVLRSHTQRTFPSVQDVVSPHATLEPMHTDPHGDPESIPILTKGQPRCTHRTGQTGSVSCLGLRISHWACWRHLGSSADGGGSWVGFFLITLMHFSLK